MNLTAIHIPTVHGGDPAIRALFNRTRLHLGCGDKRLDGFVNVDIAPGPAVDLEAELGRTPWPWEDDSVDFIYANHFFEHLPFGVVFPECWRVLKPGAEVWFDVPHANTYVHGLNPTHKTEFWWHTFDAWADWQRGSDYGLRMRWHVYGRRITFLGKEERWRRAVNQMVNPLLNSAPRLYERFALYWLPAAGIEYKLRKVVL